MICADILQRSAQQLEVLPAPSVYHLGPQIPASSAAQVEQGDADGWDDPAPHCVAIFLERSDSQAPAQMSALASPARAQLFTPVRGRAVRSLAMMAGSMVVDGALAVADALVGGTEVVKTTMVEDAVVDGTVVEGIVVEGIVVEGIVVTGGAQGPWLRLNCPSQSA